MSKGRKIFHQENNICEIYLKTDSRLYKKRGTSSRSKKPLSRSKQFQNEIIHRKYNILNISTCIFGHYFVFCSRFKQF